MTTESLGRTGLGFTRADRRKRIAGNVCALCAYDFYPVLQEHHVIPKGEGGVDWNQRSFPGGNLIILCPNCHALIHHMRAHWEGYVWERAKHECIAWGKDEAWQIRTFACELNVDADVFSYLLKAKAGA